MELSLISWNVNGIRAATKNGFLDFLKSESSDIIALQEIKADNLQIPEELHHLGYYLNVYPAEKKGYSGTLVMSKEKPISVAKGIGSESYDAEGRVITLEFDKFYFVNAYFPNSQHGLTRLDFKIDFDRSFMEYCETLRKKKPLVICGDFNVAHTEIDIARPKDNEQNAGFTKEEREWMTEFLSNGYIDTFRKFTSEGGHYSWWSYRFNARQKNIGWRIDYFVTSNELDKNVKNSEILEEVKGSDHAPIKLGLSF